MPENEFEKQVQQKMGELRFAPSEHTWEKVEKQLAEYKKRRRFLIWLPLFFLVLGGTAWYHYAGNIKNSQPGSSTKNASPANSTIANYNTAQSAVKKGHDIIPNDVIKNGGAEPTAAADRLAASAGKNSAETVRLNTGSLSNNSTSVAGKAGMIKKSAGRKKIDLFKASSLAAKKEYLPGEKFYLKEDTVSTGNKKSADKNMAAGSLTSTAKLKPTGDNEEKNNIAVIIQDKGDIKNSSAVPLFTLGDTAVIAKASTTDSVKKVMPVDSTTVTAKTKIAIKTSHKIDWGINVMAGSSSISSGLPGFEKSTSSYAFASAPPSNSGNGSVNNPGYTTPSGIKSSFAWSVGVFISKPLSRTFRISTGLNYIQYATQMETGVKLDSTTSTIVYRNGRSNVYTNRFHFIELRLLAEKQLGSASRFSINAGVSFSLLAGSNSLHFDQQKNIYYKDNSLLNKTQWNILAGINYRLLQKKARLELGPRIHYAPGGNLKKSGYDYGHWLFAGFNAKLYIGKIKK